MSTPLDGWQRLRIAVSALALVLTVLAVGMLWPERETSILKDLSSPLCKIWRDLPNGFFPEKNPDRKDECYSLQSFLYNHQVNLKSVVDYDRYLLRDRVKVAIIGIIVWVFVVLLLYVPGWSIGWLAKCYIGNRRPNIRAAHSTASLKAAFIGKKAQRLFSTKADWLKVIYYYVGATAAYAVLSIPSFRRIPPIPSYYSTPEAIFFYIAVISLLFVAFFLVGLAFSLFLALVGKSLKTEKWADIYRRGIFVALLFAAVSTAGGWYGLVS